MWPQTRYVWQRSLTWLSHLVGRYLEPVGNPAWQSCTLLDGRNNLKVRNKECKKFVYKYNFKHYSKFGILQDFYAPMYPLEQTGKYEKPSHSLHTITLCILYSRHREIRETFTFEYIQLHYVSFTADIGKYEKPSHSTTYNYIMYPLQQT